MKKEVMYSMAICFCGQERYDQMKRALVGALEVDPNDVEVLCALSQLETFLNSRKTDDNANQEDGGVHLEKAWTVDHSHPVVALSAAHSAFMVGSEMDYDEAMKPDGPWTTAKHLLQDVVDGKGSLSTKAEAHFQLGRLLHAQDLFQEAHEEYLKCKQLSPE